jgi:hypothetical protein
MIDNTVGYVHLLVSVVHPAHDTFDMMICRYCVGFDTYDPLFCDFDLDTWATPVMRDKLLRLLCDDWLTDGSCIVGCEQITGAVQWQRRDSPAL